MTQSPAIPLPPPAERRRLRESQSLTQAQVAKRVGVSRETVRAWETGRTTPRGRRAQTYASLLAAAPTPTATTTSTISSISATSSTVTAAAAVGKATVGTPAAAPLTPAQAFDALYAFCAPALVRQTYLLTGRRELARESVERAFQLAWHRWPEVAVDPDPAGWVRAAAYECALSPWHRFRARHRHPEAPPADASDRALLSVLLKLPPPYRRTLLLHDGVGLGLAETAAETEASTRAAANRLLHARETVATRLPDLQDPGRLSSRLAGLATHARLRAARPSTVRAGSERRARNWTQAAIAFTVALIGATAFTLHTAPTRYEPPVAPGATVLGVPPQAAPGALSRTELKLRKKLLQSTTPTGPERVLPEPR
ncbi:helix-turn-helix domain-containing protein [Streptomyces sp. WI04-05B]|uniref:helix-turn-helix domain-containing protein n=1 Tax=Streptomyces TaxID=1883 RepID=UPI0029ADC568|nr:MULTISPECIES: helix-turn-helix domain-containing protein [unclassified Streptomyces]MDX2543944.1 helix-turn-helix domain-containing protein [Streptomyces sp. WI04-05B]MDX2584346.1 helix-turn-helix domain-containing protein [Streptomyces sp. WI04-05A]